MSDKRYTEMENGIWLGLHPYVADGDIDGAVAWVVSLLRRRECLPRKTNAGLDSQDIVNELEDACFESMGSGWRDRKTGEEVLMIATSVIKRLVAHGTPLTPEPSPNYRQVGHVREMINGPVFWDLHSENFKNPEDWKPVYVIDGPAEPNTNHGVSGRVDNGDWKTFDVSKSNLGRKLEPSADVVERINIDVIPQGSYRSWRALVADHEWMVKLSDVHRLIEIEVERRIKERKDEV